MNGPAYRASPAACRPRRSFVKARAGWCAERMSAPHHLRGLILLARGTSFGNGGQAIEFVSGARDLYSGNRYARQRRHSEIERMQTRIDAKLRAKATVGAPYALPADTVGCCRRRRKTRPSIGKEGRDWNAGPGPRAQLTARVTTRAPASMRARTASASTVTGSRPTVDMSTGRQMST
jgi:hypothetical protein